MGFYFILFYFIFCKLLITGSISLFALSLLRFLFLLNSVLIIFVFLGMCILRVCYLICSHKIIQVLPAGHNVPVFSSGLSYLDRCFLSQSSQEFVDFPNDSQLQRLPFLSQYLPFCLVFALAFLKFTHHFILHPCMYLSVCTCTTCVQEPTGTRRGCCSPPPNYSNRKL